MLLKLYFFLSASLVVCAADGGLLDSVLSVVGKTSDSEPKKVAFGKAQTNTIQLCDYTDYGCMGKFLSYVSKCQPCVFGGMPNNFTVFNFHIESFFFSVSVLAKYQIFKNVDLCEVTAFDYSIEDDKLVYSLFCPDLRLISALRLTQHSPGELSEDYYIDFTYDGDVELTTNMGKVLIQRLDFCDAFTSVDAANNPSLGIFPVGPADKAYVASQLLPLLVNKATLVAELLQYYGPVVMAMFTSAFICDFGCYLSY